MFRHCLRLASMLAGATAGGLLLATPAGAHQVHQPQPLPPLLLCSTPWTNLIVGTERDDEILGTDGNDFIIGLGGDDTIYGGEGRDTILGGGGDDEMAGGPDDDCIVGGAGADHSVLWMFTVPNGNDDSHSVAFRYMY